MNNRFKFQFELLSDSTLQYLTNELPQRTSTLIYTINADDAAIFNRLGTKVKSKLHISVQTCDEKRKEYVLVIIKPQEFYEYFQCEYINKKPLNIIPSRTSNSSESNNSQHSFLLTQPDLNATSNAFPNPIMNADYYPLLQSTNHGEMNSGSTYPSLSPSPRDDLNSHNNLLNFYGYSNVSGSFYGDISEQLLCEEKASVSRSAEPNDNSENVDNNKNTRELNSNQHGIESVTDCVSESENMNKSTMKKHKPSEYVYRDGTECLVKDEELQKLRKEKLVIKRLYWQQKKSNVLLDVTTGQKTTLEGDAQKKAIEMGTVVLRSTYVYRNWKKKQRETYVDANSGSETKLKDKDLEAAKKDGTVITKATWRFREDYNKLKKIYVDANGNETQLKDKDLEAAIENGTVITKATWRSRKYKNRLKKIYVDANSGNETQLKDKDLEEALENGTVITKITWYARIYQNRTASKRKQAFETRQQEEDTLDSETVERIIEEMLMRGELEEFQEFNEQEECANIDNNVMNKKQKRTDHHHSKRANDSKEYLENAIQFLNNKIHNPSNKIVIKEGCYEFIVTNEEANVLKDLPQKSKAKFGISWRKQSNKKHTYKVTITARYFDTRSAQIKKLSSTEREIVTSQPDLASDNHTTCLSTFNSDGSPGTNHAGFFNNQNRNNQQASAYCDDMDDSQFCMTSENGGSSSFPASKVSLPYHNIFTQNHNFNQNVANNRCHDNTQDNAFDNNNIVHRERDEDFALSFLTIPPSPTGISLDSFPYSDSFTEVGDPEKQMKLQSRV